MILSPSRIKIRVTRWLNLSPPVPPYALMGCADGHDRVQWRATDGHRCWFCGRRAA